MKDRVSSVLASTGTGLTTALAGARWWAVLLVVLVVLGSTYGVVLLALRNPRVKRISTFLMTVEAGEPEEPPPKRRRR